MHQSFFDELGRRLRAAREAAGRSLADVAREAAVSRRYLTDAEAGRANMSLALCLRLAQALGRPLAELVDIPLRARARERIALTGLRGAGKSTVGRRLARELEVPFVELDARVEERAGLDLRSIFDLHGEPYFRRVEAETLEEVLAEGERVVLATSGSIVTAPRTFERLLETCRTVWLRADASEHYERVLAQGDRRPMQGRPDAMDELEGILRGREPLYARCEIAVETSARDVAEVVAEIVRRLAD